MFPHLQDPIRCPSRRSWPLAVAGPRSRSVILLTPDVMSVELYTMGALEISFFSLLLGEVPWRLTHAVFTLSSAFLFIVESYARLWMLTISLLTDIWVVSGLGAS